MKYAWTVVEHAGEQMTVVREGEMLEIPRPAEPSLRKVFKKIQVDESLVARRWHRLDVVRKRQSAVNTIDPPSIILHLGSEMGQSQKVEKHTGDLMELERDGEFLEIEMPIEPGPRLLFVTLRVGQVVDDAMVRILTGETHT